MISALTLVRKQTTRTPLWSKLQQASATTRRCSLPTSLFMGTCIASTHCNSNASLVESNDRIFSRSRIDLSYWALVVNTLHWCIIDEKKKFPRDIPSTPACVEPDVFFRFRVCYLMFFIDM